MKKIWYLCTLLSLSASLAQAQLNAHPEAYKIDKKDIKRAHELISTLNGFPMQVSGCSCTGAFTA